MDEKVYIQASKDESKIAIKLVGDAYDMFALYVILTKSLAERLEVSQDKLAELLEGGLEVAEDL